VKRSVLLLALLAVLAGCQTPWRTTVSARGYGTDSPLKAEELPKQCVGTDEAQVYRRLGVRVTGVSELSGYLMIWTTRESWEIESAAQTALEQRGGVALADCSVEIRVFTNPGPLFSPIGIPSRTYTVEGEPLFPPESSGPPR
jgi:hypothetical protein